MESFSDLISSPNACFSRFLRHGVRPCQDNSSILKSERDSGDSIRIIKVDIDKNRSVAAHYSVQSVPTFTRFSRMVAVMATKWSYQCRGTE